MKYYDCRTYASIGTTLKKRPIMKKYLLLLCTLAGIGTACTHSSEEEGAIDNRIIQTGFPFIATYADLDGFYLYDDHPGFVRFRIVWGADQLTQYTKYYGDPNPEKYWEYVKKNDDLYWYSQSGYGTCALGKSVVRITATTNGYYDAKHPAGSSLDDIMKVHVRTFAPFIDDKCRNPSDERVFGQYISKRLCDLTPEEGRLWDPYTLTLSIDSENHTTSTERLQITVTILFDDGQEISRNHTMNEYYWN